MAEPSGYQTRLAVTYGMRDRTMAYTAREKGHHSGNAAGTDEGGS